MRRGSLVAAVMSLFGASVALTLVAVTREVVSMYTAIGVVLLLNAAVRYRIATSDSTHDDRR